VTATSTDAITAIQSLVNTTSAPVYIQNTLGGTTAPILVAPGQSVGAAAIAAAGPIVAFEQQYGTTPTAWQAAHPGQPLPAVTGS
jgi:hypothetical protein